MTSFHWIHPARYQFDMTNNTYVCIGSEIAFLSQSHFPPSIVTHRNALPRFTQSQWTVDTINQLLKRIADGIWFQFDTESEHCVRRKPWELRVERRDDALAWHPMRTSKKSYLTGPVGWDSREGIVSSARFMQSRASHTDRNLSIYLSIHFHCTCIAKMYYSPLYDALSGLLHSTVTLETQITRKL